MPNVTPQKGPSIGKMGFIPELKDGVIVVDRTVMTPGGKTMGGIVIAGVHVVTWIVAFVMAILSYRELEKTTASADAKGLALGYSILVWGIVVLVLVHAAAAVPSDKFLAPLISMLLLFVVFFENVLGAAFLCYALTLNNDSLYLMVVVTNVLVTLGSAMVVAFYVLWSQYGNIQTIKDADRSTSLEDYA